MIRSLLLSIICTVSPLIVAAAARGAEQDHRTKLVFWNLFTDGTPHAAITEVVRRFNASNPKYFVEQTDLPWDALHQRMLAAIAGGVAPDVSLFDGMAHLQSVSDSEWGLLMALAVMMLLPALALFFFCQRFFIEGIALTGTTR